MKLKYRINLKIPRDKDRRYKLTEQDILEIKKIRKKGTTIKSLAERFKVSTSTICYYIYPNVNKLMKEKKNRKKTGQKKKSMLYYN